MSLLTREEMQQRLTELGGSELSEERRMEIITELGAQHVSGLEEQEQLETNLSETSKRLVDQQNATTSLLSRVNLEQFRTDDQEDTNEDSLQENITIDDLLEGV